jgi:anti-sigma factor RsiW
MRQSISEMELHAYADGQLSGEERLEVESFLAHNPEASRRVAAYAEQNRLLRTFFGPVLAEPADERLERAARTLRARLRLPANDNRWLDVAWRAAAASVFLLAGGAIGYRLHTPDPAQVAMADSFAQEAIQAHELVAANPALHTEQDLRLVNQSLARHIGDPINEPDLSNLGFQFVGARTGAGQAGPFGQFVYRDARGREVTMFVSRRDGPHGGFRLGNGHGDASALYWSDGPLAYALVGNVTRDQLVALTRLTHEEAEVGLAPRPTPAASVDTAAEVAPVARPAAVPDAGPEKPVRAGASVPHAPEPSGGV